MLTSIHLYLTIKLITQCNILNTKEIQTTVLIKNTTYLSIPLILLFNKNNWID